MSKARETLSWGCWRGSNTQKKGSCDIRRNAILQTRSLLVPVDGQSELAFVILLARSSAWLPQQVSLVGGKAAKEWERRAVVRLSKQGSCVFFER